MNRSLLLLPLFTGLLLNGCSSTSEPEHAAAHGNGRCNAEPVQNLVEQRLTTDLAEQARKESGAQILRVTQPHQPVTLDYNMQRLNIEIDDGDIILRVSCG